MTPRGSEILFDLQKRHPDRTKSKIIEMSLEQLVNSQAELTDAELDETARVAEILAARAEVLEKGSADNPRAATVARRLRTIVGLLGRILARAIRLKELKKETKP